MILVLMGVAGSGKTSIGRRLAQTLGWQFIEGDDFHPVANVTKMTKGSPLTDTDRLPWLTALRQKIEQFQARNISAIVACSALKQSYRAILQGDDRPSVQFIYLQAHPDTVRSRLVQRHNHFMKADMLASQFATLEPPDDTLTIQTDAYPSIDAVVAHLTAAIGLTPPTPPDSG